MKSLERLRKQFKKIQSELLDLDEFRDSTFLRKFKRQLHGELSSIKEEVRKLTETKLDKEERRLQKVQIANKNRSSKNKRNWNYVKSIQEHYFPDKPIKEIRTSLKNHRQGLENDIPDVAWRNPSP